MMKQLFCITCWTCCLISFVQCIPVGKDYQLENGPYWTSDEVSEDIFPDIGGQDYNIEYLKQYVDILRMENDILASMLTKELSNHSRKSRKIKKRNLKTLRNRRSFDSISHTTGGFSGRNTAENPTLRRLRELAALHQQRMASSAGKLQFPHGAEVLFPILHRRPA